MKNTLTISLAVLSLFACTKEMVDNNLSYEEYTNQVEILSFDSPETLFESINAGTDHIIDTKVENSSSFRNLFSKISRMEIEKDPILSYEVNKARFEGDVTLYKGLGYDELVPNENFARLLNAHGEIRVGETIYKISPRGTYFFPATELEMFEARYAEYEEMDGNCVSEKTYCLAPTVFRYDTFADMIDEEASLPMKSIPGYNWNSAETHQGSANEVFENQIFYKELQFNVRMKTRVYNHDYVVYQERGAYVKVQNKTWIGWWADKTATGLGLGWNNIIMTSDYQSNGDKPFIGMHPTRLTSTTMVFNGATRDVFEIKAYSIPESDYNTIVNGNFTTLRTKILADTGFDIWNHEVVRLYGFDYVQVIIIPEYVVGQNIDEVNVVFTNSVMSPSFRFVAGQFFYLGQDNDLIGTMRVGTYF